MAGEGRRLAAILAADVVGYSRLMAADEAGTLARFKLLRADHVEPALGRHGGRVVGEAGDSLLVEFGAASAAVACAIELQAKLAELNADLPEDRRMRFRIGINLGEVIVDGATIHGDGVNIAARLEKLAEPGGLVISRAVHDQIKGKVPGNFEDLGDQSLHNIAEPVRAYRAAADHSPASDTKPNRDDRATIAVLPFTNMSGDPEQEYFSDGITEDLITALAKSRHLSVVARNSSFLFKGRVVKVQDAGRELGARYVVEGSVRKGGNRVRVTAQLIEATTGSHVWAEKFDRDLADIFAVQDEIVTTIAARLGHSLIDAVAASGRDRSSAALTAYDHVLRGRSAWRRGAVLETWGHYRRALEADPDSPIALSSMAFFCAEDRFMQVTGDSIERLEVLARGYAERAIVQNEGDPAVHAQLGTAYWDLGELDRAKHHLELGLSLNPHNQYSIMALGLTITFMGMYGEGMAIVNRGLWLEPRIAPAMRSVPLYCHYLIGDYENVLLDFNRFDTPPPEYFLFLAASLAQLGRDDEAQRAIADFRARRARDFDIEGFARIGSNICRLPEDKTRWLEGFRKAGLIG